MIKRFLILLTLLSGFQTLLSQYPVGSWIDNMSYNQGTFVAAGGGKILCSTSSGIIVYDPQYSSVSKLSTINGLTETSLGTIAYSSDTETFIVAYNSTNVDLIRDSRITNLPDILRKNITGVKEIYRIRTNGNRAYLATSFGIVVVDLLKDEIFDTWNPASGSTANIVYDIAFKGNKILAATVSGVFEADVAQTGLAYFGNWSRHDGLPAPAAAYNCIVTTGNNLFVNRTEPTPSTDSVFVWNGSWQYLYKTAAVPNLNFETTSTGEVIICSEVSVKTLNQNGVLIREVTKYGEATAYPSNAIVSGNTMWVADRKNGLVAVYGPNSTEVLKPAGPGYNDAVNLFAENGNLWVAGGAVDDYWTNTFTVMKVSAFENGGWITLPESAYLDPLRVVAGKNKNFFISTWGMGLLEYSGSTLLNHYDEDNSPLNSIIPGEPMVRICGLAFDESGNLWITQSGVDRNIKVLRPDRSWVTIPLTINAPIVGDIIITRTGKKWIVLPRGHGIYVYDDKNTLTEFSDDSFVKMTVRDSEGTIFPDIYSLSEDLDGNIWVGTDQGPVVYFNPDKVFTDDIKATRIKIARNDGSGLADYLLKTETITSIEVDGANRKWAGTLNSGAYLLSPNGQTTISHHTAENSPLLSNSVSTIAVDKSNGIIWFGTPNGIISMRGDAPSGNDELKNVYSFPNPVRHDYTGVVTITGLVRDTNVKITDISGNLVFETTSTGSDAAWNLMNYKGERVSSGVYLAFCATPDGSGSTVIKMLVIK